MFARLQDLLGVEGVEQHHPAALQERGQAGHVEAGGRPVVASAYRTSG
ncbi:hypothetical protein [Streptomyces sp. NPDC046182]